MKRDSNQIVIVVLAALSVAAFGAIGADWWVRAHRVSTQPIAVAASQPGQVTDAAAAPHAPKKAPPPQHISGDMDQ